MGNRHTSLLRKKPQLLLLLLLALWAIKAVSLEPVKEQRREQDQKQGDQSVVGKDDGAVAVAYSLLVKCCLPNGTRMTSGFRTANDQLRVIRHYAQMEGIEVPSNMRVENRRTWEPVVAELRARGLKIADPDKTPHSDEDSIVIDLAGPNQAAIRDGCQRAESKGLVKIGRILVEGPRQAVHVELSLTGRGYQELNLLLPTSGGGGAPSASQLPSLSSNRDALRVFLDLHDQAKGNPVRQIDLDYQMLDLLDPANLADRRRLQDEIKEHEQEMAKIAEDEAKQLALNQIDAAERDDRLDDALRLARENSGKDERFKTMTTRYEAMVLINIAKEIFFARRCEDSDRASEAIGRARQVDSSNQTAIRLESEIKYWASRCSSTSYFWILFGILFLVGLVTALYFFLRAGAWELKCVDGACKGQVFDLDKPETWIGAFGGATVNPGDADHILPADIVIDDRKHRISRTHCVIWQDGRNFLIKDESANGTFVNRQPVSKDSGQRLRNKDEISLAGAATLIFQRK